MAPEEKIFHGSLDDIESIDVDSPISNEQTKTCAHFHHAFTEAAKNSEEKVHPTAARVYRFLGSLSSFSPNYDDPTQPYGPMMQWDEKRSVIVSDLHSDDFPAIRALAGKTNEHALKARLLDILWLKEHNHIDCKKAVFAYLDSAAELDTEDNFTYAADQYKRAFQLAKILGWKQEPYLKSEAQLLNAIQRLEEKDTTFRTFKLLLIALEFFCGEQKDLAGIAKNIGERAYNAGEFRKAREYWSLESEFLPKGAAETKEAALRAAETYVDEAKKREGDSFFAAATLLKDGIEALRRSCADPDRIKRLKRQLGEYQEKSLDELQVFEQKSDISDAVKAARDHVSKLGFPEAVVRLALGVDLIDLEQLRKSVIERIKKFPLSHLFGSTMMDEKGRTRIESQGFDLRAADNETQIEGKMFEQYGRYNANERATCFIRPAQEQIYNEHHPQFIDLRSLVVDNPFVPPGHESIFLRGLHAGFCGDFLVASHLLVPQIENSIRYVLESAGHDVSNLMSDGTQPVKILGPLFDHEGMKEIFGEALRFELRGLLIEKMGCDFRNRIAHGFATEWDCYSPAAVNIWWIVLRLCIAPILNCQQEIEPLGKESDE